jgi:hypothetical protein
VELESLLGYLLTRVLDRRVGVERLVDEQALDEGVDHDGNRICAAEPIVE